MTYALIVAMDKQRGIGKSGTLPWRLPDDLKYFHEVTTSKLTAGQQNAVIMGRGTWESIPKEHRPLVHRLNVVLTTNNSYEIPTGVVRASSLDEALQFVELQKDVDEVFVIGGGKVFAEAITRPECQRLYITEVDTVAGADTFFPPIPSDFKASTISDAHENNGLRFRFVVYTREQ